MSKNKEPIRLPLTGPEAFRRVKKMAKDAKKSIRAYCLERKVSHTTVYRWRYQTESYRTTIFKKLMGPPVK